eukprot:1844608-Amphidinium_carterae.1
MQSVIAIDIHNLPAVRADGVCSLHWQAKTRSNRNNKERGLNGPPILESMDQKRDGKCKDDTGMWSLKPHQLLTFLRFYRPPQGPQL